jgi:hypothetical protein
MGRGKAVRVSPIQQAAAAAQLASPRRDDMGGQSRIFAGGLCVQRGKGKQAAKGCGGARARICAGSGVE